MVSTDSRQQIERNTYKEGRPASSSSSMSWLSIIVSIWMSRSEAEDLLKEAACRHVGIAATAYNIRF